MEYSTLAIFFSLICLLITLAAVGGLIYMSSQSKFIPLVYRQDCNGNTISMTRADHIADVKVDNYRTAVADWINNIRLVTTDAEVRRKSILRTYSYLAPNDPATVKANEYLNASQEVNPFNRATNETVSIDIKSVIQQSKDSWQVDWIETVRARDGSPKEEPFRMRALVTIYQNKDADMPSGEIFMNPHYIFIKDFNWSKQL